MVARAQFLSDLDVREVSGENWQLLAPLRFYSANLGRLIEVPAGFVTDFASVPRAPFIYWFAGDTARKAAVIHDWFYRTNTEDITRAGADALFAEAITTLGYWTVRSWFMWLGVRIGGYWSYETRRTHVAK